MPIRDAFAVDCVLNSHSLLVDGRLIIAALCSFVLFCSFRSFRFFLFRYRRCSRLSAVSNAVSFALRLTCLSATDDGAIRSQTWKFAALMKNLC
jgi:hypothetical protein